MSLTPQLIAIRPARSIGTIQAQVTIEEHHTDELTITENPVEQGASVSDHAFLRPAEVIIRCGWSNSGYGALANTANNVVSAANGGDSGDTYVRTVYQKLRELQGSREPFDLVTGKRTYRNMLIAALAVTTDERSENALMVTATCRQVIIVTTKATTLPPAAAQRLPERTGETSRGAVQQLFGPKAPSLGGAFPPSMWGG